MVVSAQSGSLLEGQFWYLLPSSMEILHCPEFLLYSRNWTRPACLYYDTYASQHSCDGDIIILVLLCGTMSCSLGVTV